MCDLIKDKRHVYRCNNTMVVKPMKISLLLLENILQVGKVIPNQNRFLKLGFLQQKQNK